MCKLAKWWCHTLKKILIKYDEKDIQFDSLQEDSIKYPPQYQQAYQIQQAYKYVT